MGFAIIKDPAVESLFIFTFSTPPLTTKDAERNNHGKSILKSAFDVSLCSVSFLPLLPWASAESLEGNLIVC